MWTLPIDRRRLAFDVVLAVAMAAYALVDVVLNEYWFGPKPVNAVVVPAMTLALALRRVWPMAVLVTVIGSIDALGIAYGSTQSWASVFPFVVAVYSAAAYSRRPALAFVVVAVGVVIRDLNDPFVQRLGDLDFSSTLTVLTFLAGLEGRHLARRSVALEERADALEREEAERAAAAAARERERIARELHDIVSHGLGVIVLQAGAAKQVLEKDPDKAHGMLEAIRRTGQEAIGQMGTLLGLVRREAETSREPQPTLDDVTRLVERVEDAGLQVVLHVDEQARRVPAPLALSAYRIVQEGLTNVLKHAGPSRVDVRIHHRNGELLVEVSDDGRGGGPGMGNRQGLAGMAERVAVFGGTLAAGPRPEGGWRLRATFPVER